VVLSKYIGIMGVALASVIAMVVTSILLFISIIKLEKSFIIKDTIKKIIIITMNSIIMGVAIIILVICLRTRLNSIVLLLLGTIIGSIIYFILCYLFKIEEVIEIRSLILKKIKR